MLCSLRLCKRAGAAALLAIALAACRPIDRVDPPPSLLTQGSPPPPPRAPGPTADYHGDDVGFSQSSRVLSTLDSQGQDALLRLANAKVFTSAAIGFAGSLSPHAQAFRALLHSKQARPAFLELAEQTRPEPRLYGLAGLYLVDSSRFVALANQSRALDWEANTIQGCTYMTRSLANVIGTRQPRTGLWTGDWSRDLAGQP